MDEEKPESSSKLGNPSQETDQLKFISKPDATVADASDSLIQRSEGEAPAKEKFEQESVAGIETDPVLLNKDKDERYSLIKENSISTSIKSAASLSNFQDNAFLKCQDVSQDRSLQKSASFSDVRLSSYVSSDSLLCTPSNAISGGTIAPQVPNECKESKSICNDEEKTLFNSKLHASTHEEKFSKENVVEEHRTCAIQNHTETFLNAVQNFNSNDKLIENDGQTEVAKNVSTKCEQVMNPRLQNNITQRPSLADDSKLVKISLPTNSINIMQSNAQFLNKGRNFLNFITEKSTNIMEKALLPQHLSVKYNSVMRTVDNAGNEKNCAQESCNTESPLTELTFNNEANLMTKSKSISDLTKNPMNMDSEKTECMTNYDDKISSAPNLNEDICINTEQNDKCVLTNDFITVKNNDNSTDFKSKEIKQFELHSISNNINRTKDNNVFTETNGNCNDCVDSMVFHSEGNSLHSSSRNNLTDSMCQEREDTHSENSKLRLLQHPAYLTLLKDYAELKAKCLKLQEKVEYLGEKNRALEAENRGEIFAVQIENLEKTINRLTFELHSSLTTQETLKKEYCAANKERESMVMKYAVSEKQLIDTQRAKEYAERKVKETTKQQELLQTKVREMQGERTRICTILDGKCREVTDLQKDVERLKEDVKMRDIKLKWTQNKLKTEMDLQKETQQKLDKATTRINEMKEECDQVRKETQETMRKFQQSEENKAVTLDQQLKEQQARLILEKHVTEDKEMLRLRLQKEVETLKNRQQVLIEENNTFSLKIQDAEKDRLNYESNLSNLKMIADLRQKEIVELLSKVSELETVKAQLQHKNECLASIEEEIKLLRSANEEFQADMFACRQKEAEMLDFTQKLTDKNVRLQSDFTAIEAKAKQLEEEHRPLHERIRELTKKIKILEEGLVQEQKRKIEDCEILARHLAEQTQAAQNLAQKLEDSQGENAVLKRKQQITMKEMTRELQQCRKKLEAFETSSPYNSLGVTSRTGSNISLNTGDTLNGALSDNSMNGDQSIQSIEPSKQTLIDRIIKLQEINAKKSEKLDFFEEHTRTLVEELQKKTKIIQNYILHENSGAMGSNEREIYKAELAKHGGIMASVYNQRVSDDNMTLELSLEINQKLQAVLEDALFKNITLKDNIDTLGEEIARLTMQNQKRQIIN